MKKVGLITLYGNSNFGNKLQNYAIQKKVESFNMDVFTIRNYNSNCDKFKYVLNRMRYCFKFLCPHKLYRNQNFKTFEKQYLKNTSKIYFSNENNNSLNNQFDLFIVGSDQVWNPSFGLNGNFRMLDFTNKKISFSASFGVDSIPQKDEELFKKKIGSFQAISVREISGKDIIKRIDKNLDVEVLVDPTMLLSTDEWNMVLKKPKHNIPKKYILNYFLGELSPSRKKAIEDVAKKNGCEIINILDVNDVFYDSGPSEFIYLEKNAFLICTDSFHSCVFAFLYDRPFVIFSRENKNWESMNSRLETLLSTFKLKGRVYNGEKIVEENLNHDYSEAYKILNKERRKSEEFLKRNLNIE